MAASVPAPDPPKRDLDTKFLTSPHGLLRAAEGALSLCSLVGTAAGACSGDGGRSGFTLFVVVVALVEAALIAALFVLRLQHSLKKVVNLPLSFLLNDGILLVTCFIVCTMSLLSIGRCDYLVAARVAAALFLVALFLVVIGLLYVDYLDWRDDRGGDAKETTVTDSSPTVLT